MESKEKRTPKRKLRKEVYFVGVAMLILISIAILLLVWVKNKDTYANREIVNTLIEQKKESQEKVNKETGSKAIQILPEYEKIWKSNSDFIGWITISNTPIDYPVMQTPKDEEHYLHLDFHQEKNENGCLIMDTDSIVGVGVQENQYENGSKPSTNLIIHGHNMKSKDMFGSLIKYENHEYEKKYNMIQFDSLYEHRKYEVISVFYSKVYKKTDDVFKYYKFFNADNETAFQDFYKNIKELSLYDTGVEASYGDEFITLSTCSYQEENGRFVVVAKRK